MKIGHINLARGFRGGERQTQLLIEALNALTELDQCLIARRDSDLSPRIKCLDEDQLRAVKRPYLFNLSAASDRQLLHAHEAKAGHYALLANLRYGTPYIITRRVPNRPKDNFFTRMVYRRASRIVAISNAIGDYMLDYDDTLNIDVIPSMQSALPVDQREAEKIKAQYAGKFIVGHIGALVNHHKGQQYLIEAARRLQQTHPQIHFMLLGDGKDGTWLRESAKDLTNITFSGFVDNVGDYLSIFDMFVFPSLEEGLGSILLDVMSFSKPIIASDVDGIPDIIHHEKTGLLVPAKNSDALYDSIIRLYEDQTLRHRLASAGHRLVQDYAPEALSLHYLKLYQELLS